MIGTNSSLSKTHIFVGVDSFVEKYRR